MIKLYKKQDKFVVLHRNYRVYNESITCTISVHLVQI